MAIKHRSLIALLAVTPLLATGVRAQDVPSDVKPDHWAYTAVEDLAKKGLIKGYPPDGKFLGARTLTRYEMATIIKRILDRMDDIIKNQPKGGVSQDDFNNLKNSVGEIQALVNDFKTQLAVIGTDMNSVKSDLAALKQQVGDLSTKVDSFDARIGEISGKVDETKLLADQAIANIEELRQDLIKRTTGKVDVAVGKLRVSGLLQIWAGTAFGDTLGGNGGATQNNFGSPASGRNYGGGAGDTFRLRRGEIALVGSITPAVDFRVMFDVAKTGPYSSVSTTTASVSGTTVVTGVSQTNNFANATLQDLWVGYKLGRNWKLEVGQQKNQLSEEGTRSSSQLLTVERSIMNDLPRQQGRIGDIRETGALLRYKGSLLEANFGIWDDNGAQQNTVALDRFKFATATLYLTPIRHWTIGVWGGTKFGDYRTPGTNLRNIRDRAGATLKAEYGRHFAEAEFAYAIDRTNSGLSPLVGTSTSGTGTTAQARSMGGYALYAYTASPNWQFVGRYDEWDPSIHGSVAGGTTGDHNLREYTLGVNYYFKSHNAKIQANYIFEDPQRGGFGFWGYRRQIFLTNFQTAW